MYNVNCTFTRDRTPTCVDTGGAVIPPTAAAAPLLVVTSSAVVGGCVIVAAFLTAVVMVSLMRARRRSRGTCNVRTVYVIHISYQYRKATTREIDLVK